MSRRFELWEYAHDNNGLPVSGATLEFFEGGTAFGTPKDVFSNPELTTPIAEASLVSNSAGRWPDIFMDSALYDVRATVGNVILTRANYDPGLGAGFGVSSVVNIAQGGTSANNAPQARANLGAASQDAMTAAQNDITDIQTQIAPGLNGSDVLGVVAALASVAPANMSGQRLMLQETEDVTAANTTIDDPDIPYDSTSPTISEGEEVFSISWTPLSTTSDTEIEVLIDGEAGASSPNIVLALFNGSTLLRSSAQNVLTGSAGQVHLRHKVALGSTSTVTLSLRVGSTAGSFFVNGTGGTGTLNSTRQSYMRVREWLTKA